MENNVRSIERAMHILECFTMDKPVLTFTEIVEGSGLSKSTVARILSTLINIDYIKQDHLTQKYSLGFKLFNLGSVVGGNMTLRKIALPHMNQLCEEIHETISLNIIEKEERVYLDVVESPEEIRNFVKVGQRSSLFVGASGKALLAYMDPDHREKLIRENKDLSRQEKEKLEKELADIRHQGYLFMEQGRVKGAFAFTAPIFDNSRKLAGSITISGPIHRLNESRFPIFVEKLLRTCSNISRELGYQEAK